MDFPKEIKDITLKSIFYVTISDWSTVQFFFEEHESKLDEWQKNVLKNLNRLCLEKFNKLQWKMNKIEKTTGPPKIVWMEIKGLDIKPEEIRPRSIMEITPNKLQRLHHFAWECRDINETISFYSDVLMLPHVKTIEKDNVPSTGEYSPYKHIFFQLPDGSNIAFFETARKQPAKTDSESWVNHFAFYVSSKKDVENWKLRLEANGIDVVGPTDHDGWIYSIYFFDPNGLRLEITTE